MTALRAQRVADMIFIRRASYLVKDPRPHPSALPLPVARRQDPRPPPIPPPPFPLPPFHPCSRPVLRKGQFSGSYAAFHAPLLPAGHRSTHRHPVARDPRTG